MSTPLLSISVDDEKYTIIQHANGALEVLRHGEPWMKGDIEGSKMILALAYALEAEREKSSELNHDKIRLDWLNKNGYGASGWIVQDLFEVKHEGNLRERIDISMGVYEEDSNGTVH